MFFKVIEKIYIKIGGEKHWLGLSWTHGKLITKF
jgi:hypothetical protein